MEVVLAVVALGAVLPGVDLPDEIIVENPCPPNCSVDEAIRLASQAYGVSYDRLRCLAFRESTMNPNAVNGPYLGNFQFDLTTWNLTPYREYGRTNAYASAMGAAYLISRGESGRWPVYRFC